MASRKRRDREGEVVNAYLKTKNKNLLEGLRLILRRSPTIRSVPSTTSSTWALWRTTRRRNRRSSRPSAFTTRRGSLGIFGLKGVIIMNGEELEHPSDPISTSGWPDASVVGKLLREVHGPARSSQEPVLARGACRRSR